MCSSGACHRRKEGIRERARRADAGFLLIEILIALAIVGLIASAVGVAVFRRYVDGQEKAAQVQVRDVLGTTTQFVVVKGRCPTVEELIAAHYLPRVPVDPWGTPLEVRCPGQHEGDSADVLSLGRDKTRDTPDDIGSWQH